MRKYRRSNAPRTRAQAIRQAKLNRSKHRFAYRKHLSAMTTSNIIPTQTATQKSHQVTQALSRENVLVGVSQSSASELGEAKSAQQPAKADETGGEHTDTNSGHTLVSPSTKSSKKKRKLRNKETSSEPKPTKNPITRQWRKYKQTKFYQIWNKRPKFSYGAYTVVFAAMVIMASMFLLWSTNPDLSFKTNEGNLIQQVFGHTYKDLSTTQSYLNMIALSFIYLVCITVINRFWVGTALFSSIAVIFAVATKIKINMRSEPVIPSDLGFLTGGGGGGGGEVASFVTDEFTPLINAAVPLVIWLVVICFIVQFIDRRRGFIYCSWRHPIARPKNIFGLVCRILAPVLSIWLVFSYSAALSTPSSAWRKQLNNIGYDPTLWDVQADASKNGALTTFLSLTHVKAMDDESSYNKQAMQEIQQKYAKKADEINKNRAKNLTDSTVVMVLSESFSDPNRVPNIHFNIDPMPNIRSLKDTTTSGLMLSPGYGGGTANIEFQQMTGLNMANFSDTMLSPYQQLVANRSKFYSFNQIWNVDCGGTYSTDCSVGFHPYYQYMYLRGTNYKKFGFSHLYTLDSKPKIPHSDNGGGGNVPDTEAYKNVVESIQKNTKENKPSQYIQLITMQNHAPYFDIYGDANEFKTAHDSSNVPDDEMNTIATYAKGAQRTDQATADFLNQLDAIDKPITVVFYGDHLPGVYSTANKDKKNALQLHETDYFIWSNKASSSHNTKLPNAAYSSSNYFMTQAAEQMSAKVSPYLALLDELHQEIPAMSRSVNTGVWGGNDSDGEPTYLDDQGKVISSKSLSTKAKELLADYKMVQYDMCVGKNYLMDMGFMDVPQK